MNNLNSVLIDGKITKITEKENMCYITIETINNCKENNKTKQEIAQFNIEKWGETDKHMRQILQMNNIIRTAGRLEKKEKSIIIDAEHIQSITNKDINNLNSVLIEGTIIKKTDKEKACCITIENKRHYKNGKEIEQKISQFNIETFGNTAQECKRKLDIGNTMRAVGKLKQNKITDENNPKNIQCSTTITAHHIEQTINKNL